MTNDRGPPTLAPPLQEASNIAMGHHQFCPKFVESRSTIHALKAPIDPLSIDDSTRLQSINSSIKYSINIVKTLDPPSIAAIHQPN